ncbi:MAG: gliding motility-associated C-terminal domain-containing protein, partial [Paludibacteraceae bacterium]|nr:gliding motility-associated C-terminal domain-containing protein [Paludibacteraceae bacterium]
HAIAVDKVNGCEYTGDSVVYVWKKFWAPNAFTPNDDQRNDVFRFLGTEFITDMHFIIYNREGTIMFEGFSKEDEWDGTYNDLPVPLGVYGYVVDWKSDFRGLHKSGQDKGTVTIIR